MPIDDQDDLDEILQRPGTMPQTNDAEGGMKFANLNEALDEAGSVIGDMAGTLPIAFRFKWHDMAIFCQIADRGADVVLELTADLGAVPFTIENKQRRGYLKELSKLDIELPVGEFVVTERSRFRHRVEQVLAAPITGGSIVTSVVHSLINARPYHELAKSEI